MTTDEHLVPKVHPLTRAVESDDPMMLHATPVPGDPDEMLNSLIQEFAWLGWEAEAIGRLFRDPFYPVLHALWLAHGDSGIQERVDHILHQTGVMHFQTTIQEEPEAEEAEP